MLPNAGAKNLNKKLGRKNPCEASDRTQERALSRFYFGNSYFTVSFRGCFHNSCKGSDSSRRQVFENPQNISNFHRRLVVVCPFTSLELCRQVLFNQTPPHVVHQLLHVLPVLDTSWLFISKVSGWQGTVRALNEEMVRSEWFFFFKLISNVCQGSGIQDCLNFNHYCLKDVEVETLIS